MLEQWLQPEDSSIQARVAEIDSVMAKFYRDTNEHVMRDTIEHQVKRAIQLDQRFDVCARFRYCAQY